MKRDLTKAINEYQSRLEKGKAARFFAGDFYQIREISQSSVDLVYNGLMAGYAIGYRQAKREARKKARAKS